MLLSNSPDECAAGPAGIRASIDDVEDGAATPGAMESGATRDGTRALDLAASQPTARKRSTYSVGGHK